MGKSTSDEAQYQNKLIEAIKLKKLPSAIERSEINAYVMKALMDSNDADLITEVFSKSKITPKEIAEYRIKGEVPSANVDSLTTTTVEAPTTTTTTAETNTTVDATNTTSAPRPTTPTKTVEYSPFEYVMSNMEAESYSPKLDSASALIKAGKEASTLSEESGVKLDRIISSTNADLDGFTPLTYFASKGSLEGVANALDNGADPNFQGRNGLPLHVAFYGIDGERPNDNSVEEVEKTKAFQISTLLVERGADPDKEPSVFTKTRNPVVEKLDAEILKLEATVKKPREELESLRKERRENREAIKNLEKSSETDPKELETRQQEVDNLTKKIEELEKPKRDKETDPPTLKENELELQKKRAERYKIRKDGKETIYEVDPKQKGSTLKDSIIKKEVLKADKEQGVSEDIGEDNPRSKLYSRLLDKQMQSKSPLDGVSFSTLVEHATSHPPGEKLVIDGLDPKKKQQLLSEFNSKLEQEQAKATGTTELNPETQKKLLESFKGKVQDELLAPSVEKINEQTKKVVIIKKGLDSIKEKVQVVKEQRESLPQEPDLNNLKSYRHFIKKAEKEITASLEEVNKAVKSSKEEYLKAVQESTGAQLGLGDSLKEQQKAQKNLKDLQKRSASTNELAKAQEHLEKCQSDVSKAQQTATLKKKDLAIAEMSVVSMEKYKDDFELAKEQVQQIKQEAQKAKEDRDRKSTLGRLKTSFSQLMRDLKGGAESNSEESDKSVKSAKPDSPKVKSKLARFKSSSSLEPIMEEPIKTAPKKAAPSATEPVKESQVVGNNKVSTSIKQKVQAIGEILKKNGLVNDPNKASSNINQKANTKEKGHGL